MNKTKELLVAAKALISNEENWCQGGYSKKKEDGTISYCAVGAIMMAITSDTEERMEERVGAQEELRRHTNDSRSIAMFNDSHTHAEVMELFDKAIASVE
jgi:hypothetical protein